MIQQPAAVRMMGERGRQRVEDDWNYEYQFTKVFEHLTRPTPQKQSVVPEAVLRV
jgi:hypothetical protein